MTRGEAIAVLSDRDNFLWWEMSKAERECYSEVFDMAISALSENKGEWIPVSERLPNIHNCCMKYLVTYKHGQICTAFFVETNGRCWWSIDDVEAWQPLPEPYKSEKPETCKGCLEPYIMYEPDMRACKKKVTERGK